MSDDAGLTIFYGSQNNAFGRMDQWVNAEKVKSENYGKRRNKPDLYAAIFYKYLALIWKYSILEAQ